jgi:hypothetical protein
MTPNDTQMTPNDTKLKGGEFARYFEDYNIDELDRPKMTAQRAFIYTLFDIIIFAVKWGLLICILFIVANSFGTAIIKSLAINVCPLMK